MRWFLWSSLVASLVAAQPAWGQPERVLPLEVHLEAEGELFVVPTAGPTGVVTKLDGATSVRLTVAEGPAARVLPRFAGRVVRVRGTVDEASGVATIKRLISTRRIELNGTYDFARKRLLTRNGPVALRGVIPPSSAAGALAVRGWSYEDGLEVDAFRGWLNRDTPAADGELAAGEAVWLRAAGDDFLIAGTRPTRVAKEAIRFSPEAPRVAAEPAADDGAGLPSEAPVVPLRLLQRR